MDAWNKEMKEKEKEKGREEVKKGRRERDMEGGREGRKTHKDQTENYLGFSYKSSISYQVAPGNKILFSIT